MRVCHLTITALLIDYFQTHLHQSSSLLDLWCAFSDFREPTLIAALPVETLHTQDFVHHSIVDDVLVHFSQVVGHTSVLRDLDRYLVVLLMLLLV